MQTYGCKACGFQSRRGGEEEQMFDTFLHIFTTHLHKDIGLEREEAKPMVEQCMDYRWEMMSIGVN